MKFIFDSEKVEAVLKELQDKGQLKYVKVDKVKIRNNITRNQNLIRDIFLVAKSENSNKPWIICGIQDVDDDTVFISHLDVTHWNVYSGMENFFIEKYKLYYKPFCNPVLQYHIWRGPSTACKILKGNLMEGNPNDRYRTPESVDQDKYCPKLCYTIGGLIKSKDNLKQFFSRNQHGEMNRDLSAKYNELVEQLNKDHELVYCYCATLDTMQPTNWQRRTIKRRQINTDYIVSDYYRIFDYSNADEPIKIEPLSIDVNCVGCGSAGANIIEQLTRLNYFKNYLLVDFDIIEEKNLRNQPYTTHDIGNAKATALSYQVSQNALGNTTYKELKRFENVFWAQYKSKYTISGFDTIACRLELLEKVLNDEIKTKYIIDARYDELTASLFFIDVEDKDQVEYYHKLLLEDKEYFDSHKYLPSTEWTMEALKKFCRDKSITTCNCSKFAEELGLSKNGEDKNVCTHKFGKHLGQCRTYDCYNCLMEAVQNANYPMPAEYKESSCIAQNIIHIYKLVSSWVVSNIRSIETDNKKLFTHVEITAKPLPNAMILRK